MNVAWQAGQAQTLAFSPIVPAATDFSMTTMPYVAAVRGRVAGEERSWLFIRSANHRDWMQQGYEPSYTYVICDYKPMVKKRDDGTWEITFTSEVAENIP